MKTEWFRSGASLLAALCFASIPSLAAKGVPCETQNSPKGWLTYIDQVHGFCLRYPPIYKRVPNAVNKLQTPTFHLVTFQRSHSDTRIFVAFDDDRRFDLQSFAKTAPTGLETPPEPIKVGEYTFYYYGPGGGGVQYADEYFFNLRGKSLTITFDGPYDGDKTPSAETKKLELEILATSSVFRAPRASAK